MSSGGSPSFSRRRSEVRDTWYIGRMVANTLQELMHLAQAVRARLEFEQQMATPGLFPLTLQVSAAQGLEAAVMSSPASAPSPTEDTANGIASPSDRAGSSSQEEAATHHGRGSREGMAAADRIRRLQMLAAEAEACTACGLHTQRTHSVFARGNPEATLMFVGEGPGRDEDIRGLPFVGAAGQLLDRMIAAMGFGQDEIYICNVVKCRPPENRTPRPEEALACAHFLHAQLELVAPQAIVALGKCAAEHLGVAPPTGRWRGRWGSFRGIPVMPTYHPAFLLRSPQFKRVVWQDLKGVMARFGRTAGSSS